MEARAHVNSPASHPRKNSNTHQIGGWIIPSISKHGFGEDKNLSPLPGFEPCTFQPLIITAIVLKAIVTSIYNDLIPNGNTVIPTGGRISWLSLRVVWAFCLRIYPGAVRQIEHTKKKTSSFKHVA